MDTEHIYYRRPRDACPVMLVCSNQSRKGLVDASRRREPCGKNNLRPHVRRWIASRFGECRVLSEKVDGNRENSARKEEKETNKKDKRGGDEGRKGSGKSKGEQGGGGGLPGGFSFRLPVFGLGWVVVVEREGGCVYALQIGRRKSGKKKKKITITSVGEEKGVIQGRHEIVCLCNECHTAVEKDAKTAWV